MYREIIVRDEKGNIKRHTHEHLLTEKQWLKKQRQLRKNAVGECIRWTNHYGGGQALYFSEEQTKAISKTERMRREKAKKRQKWRKRKNDSWSLSMRMQGPHINGYMIVIERLFILIMASILKNTAMIMITAQMIHSIWPPCHTTTISNAIPSLLMMMNMNG